MNIITGCLGLVRHFFSRFKRVDNLLDINLHRRVRIVGMFRATSLESNYDTNRN